MLELNEQTDNIKTMQLTIGDNCSGAYNIK